MQILDTERLILREQKEEDAPFILELMNSPGWLKYIGDRNVRSLEDACNYILNGAMKSYKQSGFGFYLVELKDGNIPIGISGLVKRDTLEHPDVGFAFLPEYEGKGYGYESASAVMMYARDVLKLGTIVAITAKDNIVSIKLLEKIGLTFKEFVKMGEEELMLFECNK